MKLYSDNYPVMPKLALAFAIFCVVLVPATLALDKRKLFWACVVLQVTSLACVPLGVSYFFIAQILMLTILMFRSIYKTYRHSFL